MIETKKSLFDNLQNFFGFDNFKGEQEAIITNILAGNDTFVIMPTGGGKSMCYQLPALMSEGTAIVISPLIALMKNQVDQLRAFGGSDSIAHFLNSSLTKSEITKVKEDVLGGKTKLLYVAPESLTKQENIDFLRLNQVSFVAVDEAHCISEWGHDFRPEYRKIRQVISNIGDNIPIIALTATATPKVQQDIQKNLQMNNATIYKSSFNRSNLFYEVRAKRNVIKEIVKFVKQNTGKSGIIYCLSRKKVEEVAEALNLNGIKALPYHAGLDPKVRADTQDKFLMEDVDVIVATIAFGMGIDKQNIFYTFHYGLPSSVEALYQEAGRAGRWDTKKVENKDKKGKCYVLYSPETHDSERVERLFRKRTTFAEMKEIGDSLKMWEKQDIFRQVYLFTKDQQDIDEDFKIILGVVNVYFKAETTVRIFWNDTYSKLKINSDTLQKAIYRLSLLGIVSDWTTNFVNHFEVQFKTLKESSIIKSISNYITKYDPNTDVEKEISKVPKTTILEKSVWYLLNWTFENIAYSRKQSLKTLADFCATFKSSDDFKKRIDSYFVFSNTTFILQDIGENPNNYANWFEALYIFEETNELYENNLKRTLKIYIPEIQNDELRIEEYEKLRDTISRFLENNRNNIGLNFLSGFVRLALNEYQDSDGKERFESALETIKQIFSKIEQDDFLNRLMILGKTLNIEQIEKLCFSISVFYPEKLEELAEYYNLDSLLTEAYITKYLELKKLNIKLYEQLAEF